MNSFRQSITWMAVFLCISSGVWAQNFALIEHFTNTPCPICARNNPNVYEVLDKYADQVHHISIHTDAPYPNCELHLFNAQDNKARQTYYGINSTPRVYINGKPSTTQKANFESDLQAALANVRPLTMTLKESEGGVRTVEVEVTANQSLEASDYRIFVAVVERTVNYAAPNGETVHHDVLRDYVTSEDGDPIQLPLSGASMTNTYQVTIPPGVAVAEAYVMAYIQDLTTRDILGSAIAGQVTSSVRDLTKTAGLKLYPSPASAQLQVSVDPLFNIQSLEVLGLNGTRLKHLKLNSPRAEVLLPIQGLVPGTYLLRAYMEEGVASQTFIKE